MKYNIPALYLSEVSKYIRTFYVAYIAHILFGNSADTLLALFLSASGLVVPTAIWQSPFNPVPNAI